MCGQRTKCNSMYFTIIDVSKILSRRPSRIPSKILSKMPPKILSKIPSRIPFLDTFQSKHAASLSQTTTSSGLLKTLFGVHAQVS